MTGVQTCALPILTKRSRLLLLEAPADAGTQRQQLLTRDRPATQIARVRFAPDAVPPPLNSTVEVRMHYTGFSARVANVLVRLFGFY